jgi:membrane-bound lytic murein transglycosylase B
MKNAIISLVIVLVIPIILNMINPGIFNAELYIPRVEVRMPDIIMKRPFELAGFSKRTTIKFGEAYCTYAKKIADQEGIRPAFLLAILSKESSFGAYTGGCRYNDPRANMKKEEQALFEQICHNLGKNPAEQPVSCAAGSSVHGGAMGPAQFLPSTWIKIMGANADADPWNTRAAFTAAALYLKQLGAKPSNLNSEFSAASKYYSGSDKSPAGRAYAADVMNRADEIQKDINVLEEAKKCDELQKEASS